MSPPPNLRPPRPHQASDRDLRARLVRLAIAAAMIAWTGCAAVGGSAPGSAPASPEPRASATSEPRERQSLEEAPAESSALPSRESPPVRVLVVKASAYNSLRGQTDRTPDIGAWGDRLSPGMKVIAVSKDLFDLGLVRGQRVRIAGLDGEYVVLDRMPSRWRQKIDIFMGRDVRAARAWGIRQVEISWTPEEEAAVAESAEPARTSEDVEADVASEGD